MVGDKLARGAPRAQFMTTDGGVSQDKWDQAFDDFDPEAFKRKVEAECNAGAQSRKAMHFPPSD